MFPNPYVPQYICSPILMFPGTYLPKFFFWGGSSSKSLLYVTFRHNFLYNLMMKLCGISRSSAIFGSDSPQSNNRKDHSLWVTLFIPRERPNVKHAIAGYLRLPWPTSAPALMRCCIGSAVELRDQGTPLAIRPKIIARYEEAAAALGWLL